MHDIFIFFHGAGKIRFSGEQKSVLLKASSGEHCAPRNFVLLVTLRGMYKCLPHRVHRHVRNEIDYRKKNVEINSGIAVFGVFFFL